MEQHRLLWNYLRIPLDYVTVHRNLDVETTYAH